MDTSEEEQAVSMATLGPRKSKVYDILLARMAIEAAAALCEFISSLLR